MTTTVYDGVPAVRGLIVRRKGVPYWFGLETETPLTVQEGRMMAAWNLRAGSRASRMDIMRAPEFFLLPAELQDNILSEEWEERSAPPGAVVPDSPQSRGLIRWRLDQTGQRVPHWAPTEIGDVYISEPLTAEEQHAMAAWNARVPRDCDFRKEIQKAREFEILPIALQQDILADAEVEEEEEVPRGAEKNFYPGLVTYRIALSPLGTPGPMKPFPCWTTNGQKLTPAEVRALADGSPEALSTLPEEIQSRLDRMVRRTLPTAFEIC
jgi:hypothetical protein